MCVDRLGNILLLESEERLVLRYDPVRSYSVTDRFDVSESSSYPTTIRYCAPLDQLLIYNDRVFTIEFYAAPTVHHIRSLRVSNLFLRALNRVLIDVADRFLMVAHFPRPHAPDELCSVGFVLLNLELSCAVARFESADVLPICHSLLLLPREQRLYLTGRDDHLYSFQYELPSSVETSAARLASAVRRAVSSKSSPMPPIIANAYSSRAVSFVSNASGKASVEKKLIVEAFRIGGLGPHRGQFKTCVGVAASPNQSEIFVTDSGNYRIQVFDIQGTRIFIYYNSDWLMF